MCDSARPAAPAALIEARTAPSFVTQCPHREHYETLDERSTSAPRGRDEPYTETRARNAPAMCQRCDRCASVGSTRALATPPALLSAATRADSAEACARPSLEGQNRVRVDAKLPYKHAGAGPTRCSRAGPRTVLRTGVSRCTGARAVDQAADTETESRARLPPEPVERRRRRHGNAGRSCVVPRARTRSS